LPERWPNVTVVTFVPISPTGICARRCKQKFNKTNVESFYKIHTQFDVVTGHTHNGMIYFNIGFLLPKKNNFNL